MAEALHRRQTDMSERGLPCSIYLFISFSMDNFDGELKAQEHNVRRKLIIYTLLGGLSIVWSLGKVFSVHVALKPDFSVAAMNTADWFFGGLFCASLPLYAVLVYFSLRNT